MTTVSDSPPRNFTLGRTANRDAQTAAWHKVGAARPTRVMSNEIDGIWLSSSNADWIPTFPDTFPPFVSDRSDGFRGHHEPARVPQQYDDARPWRAYMWSLDADDPARLSLVRDKKFFTERWTPEPRRVGIRADAAQSLIDEYVAALARAQEVDIRLLDNQHRIPKDLRLDDEVFTALRYGRVELHPTLVTWATVQRATIELRGFALWAHYTLAFRAGFITRQEDLLPVVGCWVRAADTHIWEALTFGGVPCWRRTPSPPKDPAAYHVPLSPLPADLALDDWDDDIHHPRPEHTYGRKERAARAEITKLEAAGKHWDAQEVQDAFDGFSQNLTWDERNEARREMQGESPPPEPRAGAPSRHRSRRKGPRRQPRSPSPRRLYGPYGHDGRHRDTYHRGHRYSRSRSPRAGPYHARRRSRSPSAGPSDQTWRGGWGARPRSLSPPLLARRMDRVWRSPSPGSPGRASPRLLRRLRDPSVSPVARSSAATPVRRSTTPQATSVEQLPAARARSSPPSVERPRSESPPVDAVSLPATSPPPSPMVVSPSATPALTAPTAEPASLSLDVAADAPTEQVLVLSASQHVRTTLNLSVDAARDFVRHGWWDDVSLAAPLAPWETQTLVPPYMADQYQYPVPPVACLESDRALYVWKSTCPLYVAALNSEPPSRWAGGRMKEWKSRLRPKGIATRALRALPAHSPSADDLLELTDSAGQPWVVLDEAARAGIRWAARTFLFRRDVERLVFARTPGAPLWPAHHALFVETRARMRRVWGSASAFYPDAEEPRYLDSDDELVRLRHWRAFGALLAGLEGVNRPTIEAAMGGPVTDMSDILLRLFTSYFRDTFDRDPT
ncbi:hypothetical protein FA95DRAFT_1613275, partial [Auriscalpium vulgare]